MALPHNYNTRSPGSHMTYTPHNYNTRNPGGTITFCAEQAEGGQRWRVGRGVAGAAVVVLVALLGISTSHRTIYLYLWEELDSGPQALGSCGEGRIVHTRTDESWEQLDQTDGMEEETEHVEEAQGAAEVEMQGVGGLGSCGEAATDCERDKDRALPPSPRQAFVVLFIVISRPLSANCVMITALSGKLDHDDAKVWEHHH